MLDGKEAGKLMTATTKIYEDFSFQDFTGHWIDKVACPLNSVEDNVFGLLGLFTGARSPASKTSKKKLAKKTKKQMIDEDLLNNPQGIDKVKSQAEIGSLLASFS